MAMWSGIKSLDDLRNKAACAGSGVIKVSIEELNKIKDEIEGCPSCESLKAALHEAEAIRNDADRFCEIAEIVKLKAQFDTMEGDRNYHRNMSKEGSKRIKTLKAENEKLKEQIAFMTSEARRLSEETVRQKKTCERKDKTLYKCLGIIEDLDDVTEIEPYNKNKIVNEIKKELSESEGRK